MVTWLLHGITANWKAGVMSGRVFVWHGFCPSGFLSRWVLSMGVMSGKGSARHPLLSSVCYYIVYVTVKCVLFYVTVMYKLLSGVRYCHVYVTIKCMFLSDICYCQVYGQR